MRTQISASLIFSTILFPSFAGSMGDMHNSPFRWSGFYGGGNVGLIRYTQNITDDQAVTFNATIQQIVNPQFSGGLQLGYR